MGGETQQVIVPGSLDGARLDFALAQLSGLSRTRAKRLLEAGEAGRSSVEPEAAALPRTPVEAGDVLWFRGPERQRLRPHSAAIDVRYQDRHLAAIDKPSGMVTHPGPGHHDGTLVSVLLDRWPEVEGVGEYPRWGIVHRLDRDTSGVMLIARRPQAHRGLSEALAARQIRRSYLVLVHGAFRVTTGTIEAPIARRRARRFVGTDGKPAVTHYRRLASWTRPDTSLLEVTLQTGRTHQIRVHMESIGHYVVGDPAYGRPAGPGVDPGRVWLHARRLAFRHPITGQDLDVTAPLPADLRSSLDTLGNPDQGSLSIRGPAVDPPSAGRGEG